MSSAVVGALQLSDVSLSILGMEIVQTIRQTNQLSSFYGIVKLQPSHNQSELFDVVLEIGYKVGVSGDPSYMVVVQSDAVATFDEKAMKAATDLLIENEKKTPIDTGPLKNPVGVQNAVARHPFMGLLHAELENISKKWLGTKMTRWWQCYKLDKNVRNQIAKDVEDCVYEPIRVYLRAMTKSIFQTHIELKAAK